LNALQAHLLPVGVVDFASALNFISRRFDLLSERIYRDPVHNIIRLRTDTDEGELMMRLIDPPR